MDVGHWSDAQGQAFSPWVSRLPGPAMVAGLCAALLIGSIPSAAAWSNNPAVNTPICTAANNQHNPQLISDGLGGTIITWQDYRNDEYNIYAQRVNSAGAALWAANGVAICTAASEQRNAQLISDGAGGVIIAWEDFRSGNADIYAQRVSSAGAAQSTANGVAITTSAGNQYSPQLISDGGGGAIITWYDFRSGNADIYAQRVDSSGAALWSANGVATCTAVNDQNVPELISDGAGGAIITWEDRRREGTSDVYAQLVGSTGAAQWTDNGVVISTDAGFPQLVSDGAGGAIITWGVLGPINEGVSPTIWAQRVNSFGAVQWTANGVTICPGGGGQYLAQLISDGAGGAIITWEDTRIVQSDIYVQRVNSAGAAHWTARGIPMCTAANNQHNPQPVGDGDGGAIITWEDRRSGNTNDIYAQRVNSAGAVQWTADGVAICTAVNTQNSSQLIGDGAGGAIITWHDARNYLETDIYAQRVESAGNLPVASSVEDWNLY